MRRLAIASMLVAAAASASPTGVVEGEVQVIQKGLTGTRVKANRANVVIELVIPGRPPRPLPMRFEISQRYAKFNPDFLAVWKGARVSFPNDDNQQHSVFSRSDAKSFDLHLYSTGTSPSVQFDRAGLVSVHCSIHYDMSATIRVLESAWFTTTGADGRFRIVDVPAGTWPARAWPERGDPSTGTVTVAPGGAAEWKPTVTESAPSAYHLDRNGRPYPAYP